MFRLFEVIDTPLDVAVAFKDGKRMSLHDFLNYPARFKFDRVYDSVDIYILTSEERPIYTFTDKCSVKGACICAKSAFRQHMEELIEQELMVTAAGAYDPEKIPLLIKPKEALK